ncbi:hypothetical protein J6590_008227 [Homalodisca vitripennis]|nr:hypothetical protein J6590_008227 [Homalodisca vitripennis]
MKPKFLSSGDFTQKMDYQDRGIKQILSAECQGVQFSAVKWILLPPARKAKSKRSFEFHQNREFPSKKLKVAGAEIDGDSGRSGSFVIARLSPELFGSTHKRPHFGRFRIRSDSLGKVSTGVTASLQCQ